MHRELTYTAEMIHLVAQCSNFSFELIDAKDVVVPRRLMELANRVVPFASLAWGFSIASNL